MSREWEVSLFGFEIYNSMKSVISVRCVYYREPWWRSNHIENNHRYEETGVVTNVSSALVVLNCSPTRREPNQSSIRRAWVEVCPDDQQDNHISTEFTLCSLKWTTLISRNQSAYSHSHRSIACSVRSSAQYNISRKYCGDDFSRTVKLSWQFFLQGQVRWCVE